MTRPTPTLAVLAAALALAAPGKAAAQLPSPFDIVNPAHRRP